MKTEIVPLDSLHLDPANVREHDERNLGTIRASLTRFGAGRSIVLDGKGVVRAGNGTVAAARDAGITAVVVVEPEPGQIVAVRRADWSASEATAYGIADNRSTDLSTNNDQALAETLRALQSEEGFDIAAVGYTDDEVDRLIERLGSEAIKAAGVEVDDPQAEWEGMPAFDNPARASRVINVHFTSDDGVQQFATAIGKPITADTKTLWYPEPPESLKDSAWVTSVDDPEE